MQIKQFITYLLTTATATDAATATTGTATATATNDKPSVCMRL